MIEVALVTAVLVAIIGLSLRWEHYKLPPGPRGLPFVGIAFKLDPKGSHRTITQWSEEFGDVFKIKIFGQDFVVLNSFDTIFDAMVTRSTEFAGRQEVFILNTFYDNCDGLAFRTYNEKWCAMKKLTLKVIKNNTEDVERVESINLESIDELLTELEEIQHTNQAVNPKPLIYKCLTSIISTILYGKKFDSDFILKVIDFDRRVQSSVTQSLPDLALNRFPSLRHLPLKDRYRRLLEHRDYARGLLDKVINEGKEDYARGRHSCFLDGLFEYQERSKVSHSEINLSNDDIYGLNLDMLLAGTVSSTLVITTFIAILVNKPKVQKRMADEIREKIGGRRPSLKDKPHLPYMEAAVLETLRYYTLNPLGVVHTTTINTTINGYDIPCGMPIFFNLWKVNHDPKFWERPWEFQPERFLNDQGRVVPVDHPKRKRVLTFGAGRRICPGEGLARKRIFLIMTSLLQHFELLPESEDNRPLHDPRDHESGFNIFPKAFRIRLQPRK